MWSGWGWEDGVWLCGAGIAQGYLRSRRPSHAVVTGCGAAVAGRCGIAWFRRLIVRGSVVTRDRCPFSVRSESVYVCGAAVRHKSVICPMHGGKRLKSCSDKYRIFVADVVSYSPYGVEEAWVMSSIESSRTR